MLRYKIETRPGLVALYDIRPGNGAGPFLQPRSPHGAPRTRTKFGERTFSYAGPSAWNTLPRHIRETVDSASFGKLLL